MCIVVVIPIWIVVGIEYEFFKSCWNIMAVGLGVFVEGTLNLIKCK